MVTPRLLVLAPTYEEFARWCVDHGLSRHSRYLIHIGPSNAGCRLRGTYQQSYTVLRYDGWHDSPVWAELRIMRAVRLTEAELAAWLAQVKQRAS